MLTETQIDAGAARLTANKLATEDVDKLVGVLRMFFGDLETKYGYAWHSKLEALDDALDTARTTAQVAACIISMEALGFGVSSLQGGSDALYYKEKDEYWQYVIIVHTKFYTLPPEFGTYSLARRAALAKSGTATSKRVERGGFDFSERGRRARTDIDW